MYDANKPGELERAEAFRADIFCALRCHRRVLTGSMGRVEKRDLMPTSEFTKSDLAPAQASNAPSMPRAC